MPHPAWAQGSSCACWQGHGGAPPHMGTGLFTCMLAGAGRCPTLHGHRALHVHVGRIMEVPCLVWAHTCMLAGSREVPPLAWAQGSSHACWQGAGRCPTSHGHTVLHVHIGREHGGARSGPCTSIRIFAHSYYLRRPMMLVLLPLRLTVCLMPLYKEGLTVTSKLVVCLQLFP